MGAKKHNSQSNQLKTPGAHQQGAHRHKLFILELIGMVSAKHTHTATNDCQFAQYHEGMAPSPPSDWVVSPLSFMTCSILPCPFKNTPNGDVKELSRCDGQTMPVFTVTA